MKNQITLSLLILAGPPTVTLHYMYNNKVSLMVFFALVLVNGLSLFIGSYRLKRVLKQLVIK